MEHPSIDQQYLAQITAAIYNFMEGFRQKPKTVKIDDCILKYKTEEESQDSNAEPDPDVFVSEAQKVAAAAAKSKAIWGAILQVPELMNNGQRGTSPGA